MKQKNDLSFLAQAADMLTGAAEDEKHLA